MSAIYKLCFHDGTFYVGKTTKSPAARIRFHLNQQGKGSPLLEQAFLKPNNYSHFEVLEDDVALEVLDATEQYWIAKLNPALNVLPGGEGLHGLNHPRSKYSYEQIQEVVRLLLKTAQSYQEIADSTGVGLATVRDIAFERGQQWIYERLDKQLFENARELRNPHYKIYDKDNNCYITKSQTDFLKQHPDCPTNLFQGTKGSTRSGYQLYPHEVGTIKKDDFEFTTTLYNIREFLKTQDLSAYQIRQILKGKQSQGWAYKKLTTQSI